jgi:excisionase family DNA binding protein
VSSRSANPEGKPSRRPRLLTIREAGEVSGLGARFMLRLVQDRRIDSYKLGGKRLIDQADLDAYIERGRCEATREPDFRR